MERTLFLRKFTDLVRYDRLHNSLSCLLIMSIGVLGAFNSLMVILTEQQTTEKRLLGVKECVILILLMSATLERALNPSKTTRLAELIENEFLVNCYEFSQREEKWKRFEIYYNQTKNKMEKTSKNLRIIFVIMYLGFINREIFNKLLRDFMGLRQKSNDFPVSHLYWNPDGLNTIEFFLYIYTFQSLIVLIFAIETYCIQISVSLSSERLLADFGTVYILIDDLAKDFPEVGIADSMTCESHQHENMDNNFRGKNENLKEDMNRIVRCHQSLIRNFKDCETNAGYVIIIISVVILFDTCVVFYLILKADNLITSISYAMSSILINLAAFFPYHTGQRIANQNDILRQCLTNVPWIDKPRWFKKTLHIMMMRANVDIVMKPFGIHYLNHMSFKSITKAAFSFGNFLYTTKLKGQTQ